MGTRPEHEHANAIRRRLEAELPRPTAGYRRRAWLAFQLALGRKQCLGSRFEFQFNGIDRSFQTDAGQSPPS
jgi:hypothetical protein